MTKRYSWTTVLGLVFVLGVPLSSHERASAADTRGTSPTTQEKKAVPTVSLVGTIVAIVPESRTLLVDVAVGADFLRVAAVVTPRTRIEATGAPASFEDLQPGNRVRLNFRRITTGNEALSVEVLRGAKS
jgi:hypothetical protein